MSVTSPASTDVWADVVGQEAATAVLAQAATDPKRMTHAWLITGPPGSGRSTAARAFAASLLCDQGGCGSCHACRTSIAGGHPDVTVVATEHVHLRVQDVRPLVSTAQQRPTSGRWRVIIIEDADRLNESSGNVLLKAIEEPPERTVWLLCAPSPVDVLVTIRSRCRQVGLRIPPPESVAELLIRRDGIEPELAQYAARAAASHVGIARRLAQDESARERRREILLMPRRLTSVPQAVVLAGDLVEAAKAEAAAATTSRDESERSALLHALGAQDAKTLPPAIRAQVRALEENQKRRATRAQRDVLDRALMDVLSLFRDVLMVQLGSTSPLINEDLSVEISAMARSCEPDVTLRRMDAIGVARARISANVTPVLAIEALMVGIFQAGRSLDQYRENPIRGRNARRM